MTTPLAQHERRIRRLFREGMVLVGLAVAVAAGCGVLLATTPVPWWLATAGITAELIVGYQALGTAVAGIRGIPGVDPAQLSGALGALAMVKRFRLWWLWACWPWPILIVGGAAYWESVA
ncbi:hypothetical protein Afil01_56120 [Actinorhabdospora filicis]|uniref:Uncharacterized protein n=1 Tax=Actinorhabdospora filicis TaxID=1785913 RepID=A0A9W6SRU5_9ACTN|nr:hypothetical protein [Actinorhabdospora filicis]GLZ80805.1 hypothetical protein Afil01_56120 [Actinorhabdospora filicis]